MTGADRVDSATILEVTDFQKTFRLGVLARSVEAVRGVSFEVRQGEVVGFIGPNGAGKTTTIKAAMGLIRPSAGRIALFGEDVSCAASRARIGYLPEAPYFYDYLKPQEVLDYAGRLCGVDARTRKERIPKLLDRLGLSHATGRTLRRFSKGMLQRVGLAQVLIHDPDLVVLDEPLSGLDPVGRKDVRDLLGELRAGGKTLFFSSHVLSDVESLCDSVVIIDQGRVVARGALGDLLRPDRREAAVVIALPERAEVDIPALVEGLAQTRITERTPGRVRFIAETQASDVLVARAIAAGCQVVSVDPLRDTLEELFMRQAVRRPEEAA